MSNNASAALSQSTHQANEYSVLNTLRSPKRLRTELFAGIAVALALIPEAISFSILAGVDPQVGLFTSFTMAVTIAFVGGRRAMISAATGAVALVVAPVVADHGLDYLIATVLLAGVLQVVFSLAGAAKLMRFLPRSVMVGFVNALAIVIFTAQIPELIDVPAIVYPLVAIGLLILVFLPRLSQVVPAPSHNRRCRNGHRCANCRRSRQFAQQSSLFLSTRCPFHFGHLANYFPVRIRHGPGRSFGVVDDSKTC
jgi:sulfate permease, SulP family